MKQPRSSLSTRTSLAAACAVLLGSVAAFAQSNTTASGANTNPRTGTSSRDSTYQSDSTSASSATTSASGSYNASDKTHSSHAATTTSNDRAMSSGKLGFMDRRFVSKAADEGQAEVAIAQLAAERATNPEVRSAAQKFADDHKMMNSELTTLATQKNVKLDTDDDHDRAYKRLSKKSGADFDQEFVEHMIDAHEKDIKMFEKAAKDAKDADIRSFASKHVDHLREHLRTAEGLRTSTMPTGRDDGTSGRATTSEGTSSNDGVGTSGAGAATSGIGAGGAASSSQTGSSTNSSADQKRGGKP